MKKLWSCSDQFRMVGFEMRQEDYGSEQCANAAFTVNRGAMTVEYMTSRVNQIRLVLSHQ